MERFVLQILIKLGEVEVFPFKSICKKRTSELVYRHVQLLAECYGNYREVPLLCLVFSYLVQSPKKTLVDKCKEFESRAVGSVPPRKQTAINKFATFFF